MTTTTGPTTLDVLSDLLKIPTGELDGSFTQMDCVNGQVRVAAGGQVEVPTLSKLTTSW